MCFRFLCQEASEAMMEDAVNVFLELREADLAAENAEEKEAAEAEMLGESNAAENGMSAASMENSPVAGAGAAADEGSPGRSQAAINSRSAPPTMEVGAA